MIKEATSKNHLPVAGNSFKARVEGALALRFDRDGLASGTPAGSDLFEEFPGGGGINLNENDLFAKIIGHCVSFDFLNPAGFERDGRCLIVRNSLEGHGRGVAGIRPDLPGHDKQYCDDCRCQRF